MGGANTWYCISLCVLLNLSNIVRVQLMHCCCSHLPSQSQEKEALDAMKRRAKELQLAKKEARKAGRTYSGGGFGGGGGGGGYGHGSTPVVESLPSEPPKSSYKAPR